MSRRDESDFCCIPTCCMTLRQNESLILTGCSSTQVIHGPYLCYCNVPCLYKWEIQEKVELFVNDYVVVMNTLDPSLSRYEFGPKMVELDSAWEVIVNPEVENFKRATNMQLMNIDEQINRWDKVCRVPILDADEYLVKANQDGIKTIKKGPLAFMPEFGEVWGNPKKSINIPINKYIVINNSNSSTDPVSLIRGPLQYFPESFETVQSNPQTGENLFDCVHVNASQGYHLQRKDGQVVLLSEPQFYMPKVGEKIIATVSRLLLLQTDFCILKAPDGRIMVVDGHNPAERSFLMKPFHEFVYFDDDEAPTQRKLVEGEMSRHGKKFILSTLPQYLMHQFMIRTSDNVALELDVRISYQINDVHLFSANPIQFSSYMKYYVQDEFLDRFARVNLREYMNSFTAQAIASIDVVNAYFESFGITIIDIQILKFTFVEQKIADMLETDIHTNVTKQNELRVVQNDALIQEQSNEVIRRQKDLDVALSTKNNEVELQKRILKNDIRVKEMEIQISEEKKRTELLTVRRENELIECEFRGRAKGRNLKEFMDGIDTELTADQKLQIWKRDMDLRQAALLYNSTDEVTICPPGADIKVFKFSTEVGGEDAKDTKRSDGRNGTANADVAVHNFVSAHEKERANRMEAANRLVLPPPLPPPIPSDPSHTGLTSEPAKSTGDSGLAGDY